MPAAAGRLRGTPDMRARWRPESFGNNRPRNAEDRVMGPLAGCSRRASCCWYGPPAPRLACVCASRHRHHRCPVPSVPGASAAATRGPPILPVMDEPARAWHSTGGPLPRGVQGHSSAGAGRPEKGGHLQAAVRRGRQVCIHVVLPVSRGPQRRCGACASDGGSVNAFQWTCGTVTTAAPHNYLRHSESSSALWPARDMRTSVARAPCTMVRFRLVDTTVFCYTADSALNLQAT